MYPSARNELRVTLVIIGFDSARVRVHARLSVQSRSGLTIGKFLWHGKIYLLQFLRLPTLLDLPVTKVSIRAWSWSVMTKNRLERWLNFV